MVLRGCWWSRRGGNFVDVPFVGCVEVNDSAACSNAASLEAGCCFHDVIPWSDFVFVDLFCGFLCCNSFGFVRIVVLDVFPFELLACECLSLEDLCGYFYFLQGVVLLCYPVCYWKTVAACVLSEEVRVSVIDVYFVWITGAGRCAFILGYVGSATWRSAVVDIVWLKVVRQSWLFSFILL